MTLSVTARGTGTNNTSALTFTLSPASNFAAGMAVIVIACDNSDSSGQAHSTFTVTDTLGNTWTRRISPLYDPGAASAGVEGAIFTTYQNGGTLTTGTTITVTFDANSTAECWALWEVTSSVDPQAIVYVTGGVNTGSATASPTVTTGTITSGDVVIGGLFNEQGTGQTVTGDSDSTNGSWSSQQTAEIGTTAAGMTVSSQYKVVTGTATQTYNPTLGTSSDVILGWIQLREATVDPSGIASSEAFGTTNIDRYVAPSGIGSAEAFGSANLVQYIDSTAIASQEVFGSATTEIAVAPTGVATQETFGAPTVEDAGTGSNIDPSGIPSSETFGSAAVDRYVAPSGAASAEAFGSATTEISVNPSGISSTEVFGSQSIERAIAPTGIASSEAIGAGFVDRYVAPTGVPSTETFGAAHLARTVNLAGIASGEIVPAGSFGTEDFIDANGVASSEVFGTGHLSRDITASGVASSETFGADDVYRTFAAAGIASAEAFGSASVAWFVAPIGIAGSEAFGVGLFGIVIAPSGLPSGEVFGVATIEGGEVDDGIPIAVVYVGEQVRVRFTHGVATVFLDDEGAIMSESDLRILRQGEVPKTITARAFTADAYVVGTNYSGITFELDGVSLGAGSIAADGTLSFTFTGTQLDVLGDHVGVWKASSGPGGEPQTFPEETNLRIQIIA